jgi:hypothetical protein
MVGRMPETRRSSQVPDLQIHLHHAFTYFHQDPEIVPYPSGAQILANIGVFENCKTAFKRGPLA